MIPGRVSVLIPSRHEPYLLPTVADVLKNSRGDIEIIVVLDGWWNGSEDAAVLDDPRVTVLHWGEAQALRPSLNAAVQVSHGEFLFKLDAHCSLDVGYDITLAGHCEDGTVVVPAKYSLNAETWTRFRDPWHYFYLMWPWQEREDPLLGTTTKFVGLQDKNYDWSYCQARSSVPVDEILSYQGSAWMLRRSWWDRILPSGMNPKYYYAQEPQEVGLTTYMEGGRCLIVKDTWYAHLWKGSGVNKRKFTREKSPWDEATRWSCRQWMRHPGFPALIEKFGPFPEWPLDWQPEARRQWRTRR